MRIQRDPKQSYDNARDVPWGRTVAWPMRCGMVARLWVVVLGGRTGAVIGSGRHAAMRRHLMTSTLSLQARNTFARIAATLKWFMYAGMSNQTRCKPNIRISTIASSTPHPSSTIRYAATM